MPLEQHVLSRWAMPVSLARSRELTRGHVDRDWTRRVAEREHAKPFAPIFGDALDRRTAARRRQRAGPWRPLRRSSRNATRRRALSWRPDDDSVGLHVNRPVSPLEPPRSARSPSAGRSISTWKRNHALIDGLVRPRTRRLRAAARPAPYDGRVTRPSSTARGADQRPERSQSNRSKPPRPPIARLRDRPRNAASTPCIPLRTDHGDLVGTRGSRTARRPTARPKTAPTRPTPPDAGRHVAARELARAAPQASPMTPIGDRGCARRLGR